MLDLVQELAQDPFMEFALLLFLAAILGSIGILLRQPLIVMFIALGVLVGPSVLGIVNSKESIHLLAEIGIAVLLFIVGLKLDLRIIRSVGKIATLTGLGQVFFTSFIGYLLGLALGFSNLHSFYIAVALTFSSTIIIVKLLSDKKEVDALHGQIAIGFLIVQDIVVILVMIILSALRQGEEQALSSAVGQTLASGAGLLLITFVATRYVLPRVTQVLARSTELLTLFAVAWSVGLAAFGTGIGFSGEVGAFLAGVSLASSDYREMISSRLISLRDFLLLFFFVNLGANLDLSLIGGQVLPALIFSLFVLIGNPIIVLIIMGAMGYRKRTAFLSGLTVAQISEFSLIFAGLGLAIGHITEEILGLITLISLITIALSTYLILYSHPIYEWLAPALRIFERKNPSRESEMTVTKGVLYDVIIIGVGRFGGKIASHLEKNSELSFLGVDFDPRLTRAWKAAGRNVFYGDLEDPEIIHHIPLLKARVIISTIQDRVASQKFIQVLRNSDYSGAIYLSAQTDAERGLLANCGATDVLLPQEMAADYFYEKILLTHESTIEKAP
ncbi:MAG: cation:proton antiporter [Nitritalea sp.]